MRSDAVKVGMQQAPHRSPVSYTHLAPRCFAPSSLRTSVSARSEMARSKQASLCLQWRPWRNENLGSELPERKYPLSGTRTFSYSSQAAYTHLTGKLGPKGPQTVPHSDAASLLVPTENELTFPTGDIFILAGIYIYV